MTQWPIPTKLSCDPAYAGYRPDAIDIGWALSVRLDGVDQKMVVAYDLIEQCIVRVRQDEAGNFMRDGEDVALEKVRGLVEVDLVKPQ